LAARHPNTVLGCLAAKLAGEYSIVLGCLAVKLAGEYSIVLGCLPAKLAVGSKLKSTKTGRIFKNSVVNISVEIQAYYDYIVVAL
jgi:hypothetical protein